MLAIQVPWEMYLKCSPFHIDRVLVFLFKAILYIHSVDSLSLGGATNSKIKDKETVLLCSQRHKKSN